MKLLKTCILFVPLLIAQLLLLHTTSHGKTTLFDKGQATHKSSPLSKIKNDAAIILTIHFPEGYHLIKDAGSSYTLALGENILTNGTILTDETSIAIPYLLDIRSTLVLNLNYYYCTKKGVCFFQLTRWSIPVEVRQDGVKKISITEIPDEVNKERRSTPLSF